MQVLEIIKKRQAILKKRQLVNQGRAVVIPQVIDFDQNRQLVKKDKIYIYKQKFLVTNANR